MPTIRGILGIRENPVRPFDGMDVTGVLSGKEKTMERDLYLGCGALVNNRHKLILPDKNDNMKIDDVFLSYYPDDPFETTNVAGTYPAEVSRMRTIVEHLDAAEPASALMPFGAGKDGFVAPFEWKVEKE